MKSIRLWLRLLPVLAVVLAVVFASTRVVAVHDTGLFQLDGNAVDSDLTTGEDWSTLYTNQSSSTLGFSFVGQTTEAVGADTNYFTGGGSKDIYDLSRWRYGGNSVPDKNQITNAYAAAYSKNGNMYAYFGADRYSNDGDSAIGFWFFKDTVSLNADGTFSGRHMNGDVFIVGDFTTGGSIGTVTAYEWMNGALQLMTSGGDCRSTTSGSDIVCARVNGSSVTQNTAPWPYDPKPNIGTSGTFPPLTFFEGGINLTALLGSDTCFSTFLAETRSSQETTAQLKDLAIGGFNTCDANLSMTGTDTNAVGVEHTFTVTANSSTGTGFSPASAANVRVTLESANGATPQIIDNKTTCDYSGHEDTASDIDSNGQCTVTFVSNTPGTVTGYAYATITAGNSTLTRDTDPRTIDTGAGNGGSSVAPVKTYVDARISITPVNATNAVNTPHQMVILLEKNLGDGSGWVAFGGQTVSAAVTQGDCNFVESPADATPKAASGTSASDGKLTVTINSSAADECTVEASYSGEIVPDTNTAANNDTYVTRTTDPDANKMYVDARISITPATDTNAVGVAHVMTILLERKLGDAAWSAFGSQTVTAVVTSGGCAFVGETDGTPQTTSAATDATGHADVTINSSTAQTCVVEARYSGDIVAGNSATNVSRTSDPDAQKVYVDADISITPASATNAVNTPHTLTITLRKDLGDGSGWTAFAGQSVSASITSGSCDFVESPADSTPKATSGTTGTDGKLEVTINSSSVGQCVVEASFSGQIVSGKADTNVTRTTDPDAVKTYVNARISITPTTDTNGITEPHKMTILLEKNLGDGNGWVAFGGQTVSADVTSGTCAFTGEPSTNTTPQATSGTTGSDGKLDVTINSSTEQTCVVEASYSGNIVSSNTDTHVSRSTDPDATKVYVDGSLSWLKKDDQGNLLGSAQFRVCRTANWNSGTSSYDALETPVCQSVTDNSAPDVDSDNGEFLMEGLVLGRYTVKETQAPEGYAIDPDTETVELSLTSPDGSVATPFVNPQLFKMIVITCNTTTENLAVSQVKLDLNGDGDTLDAGETLDTIAFVPGDVNDADSLLGKHVTAQDLCGQLGGAEYDNLPRGQYTPKVQILKPE